MADLANLPRHSFILGLGGLKSGSAADIGDLDFPVRGVDRSRPTLAAASRQDHEKELLCAAGVDCEVHGRANTNSRSRL